MAAVVATAPIRAVADVTLAAPQPLAPITPTSDVQANVKVLLIRYFGGLARVYVTANGPYAIRDDQGTIIVNGTTDTLAVIACKPDIDEPTVMRIAVSTDAGTPLGALTPPTSPSSPAYFTATTFGPDTTIQLATSASSKRLAYRGTVAFAPLPTGKLRIVNTLAIEDYVRGVVKAEIGDVTALEATKAQAVAARTYAVHNLGRLATEGADVDDTTRCQGYVGVSGETGNVPQAVSATTGQVLVYNGAAIDAMYSTECGGTTAPGPASEPYLRPVVTKGCAEKPGWTFRLEEKDCAALVRRTAADAIGTLKKLKVTKTDLSGRAEEVTLTGSDGTATVSGIKLRQVLGADKLRSTLFTVKATDDGSIAFAGQGWGHGLGMCQCGAIMRASGANPETYDQILADYYPGTQLAPLTPALLVRPQPVIGPVAQRATATFGSR